MNPVAKRLVKQSLLFPVLLAGVSCSKAPEKPAPAPIQTFASPQEAGDKLLAAAESGDRKVLVAIFGPSSGTVLFTGNERADDTRLRGFANAYKQMHRWRALKAGGQVLILGA